MADTVIRLENVTKQFGGEESAAIEVLRGVDLELQAGETLAIVGPSGSGKSTLLNIMGSLLPPSDGRVLVEGRPLATLSVTELADLRNTRIGFIFQLHHLLPQCTVLENVLVPVLPQGKAAIADAEVRARDLLKRVGLGERIDHFPGQLSGGERQRTAVVRALVNQPAVILADEPTGSLDHSTASGLADLLMEIRRETGVALAVVTHSRDLASRMERRLELVDGRLQPANGE